MLAAVVLAGGDARRMGGGDKPLLEVGGRSMLQAVIEALDLPDTAISANGDASRFAAFGLPVLADGEFAGLGPLAGVLAGLRWAEARGAGTLITAPGDMPFLPKGLPDALLPAPAAAVVGGQPHHLVATWPVACAGRLERFLRTGAIRRVRDFAALIGMRYKDFPATIAGSFANINTQQQLVDARRGNPRLDRPPGLECINLTAATERKLRMEKTVAIAGLGAIGLPLARALDQGVDGLRLVSVSARDQVKARANLAGFRRPPRVVEFPELSEADIVVEAAPAAVFERIALPVLERGRILIPASAGALLPRMHLARLAKQTGARIIVPTGALLGLDAVRAAAEGPVESVTLETRKPPLGLAGAPYLEKNGIDVLDIDRPTLVFEGNALDAATGFPANVNVAAALALAGVGPVRTQVRIWADPGVTRNIHTIKVEAEAARFTMTIENVPSAENPKTGRLTALSLLACLRGLVSTLKAGS